MSATTLDIQELTIQRGPTRILSNFNLVVQPGEVVALMGPSGTGKTSVLHCIAGLLNVESGSIRINGHEVASQSVNHRAELRRKFIGQMFQSPELLPELNIIENVALTSLLDGVSWKASTARALAMLESVGIESLAQRHIDEISGGESQRVALARALSRESVALLLADEPTAALDRTNAEMVTQALIDACNLMGKSALIATHDERVAQKCDRIVNIEGALCV